MSLDLRNMQDIIHSLNEQMETLMLEQLGDLVKKGLLVWHKGAPMIVQEYNRDGDQFKVSQVGYFELKDKEYIDRLEKENTELRKKIQTIFQAVETL